MFLSNREIFDFGTCGLLRVSIYDRGQLQNFNFVGSFEETLSDGQYFKVHNDYAFIWSKLIEKLEDKQIAINNFLQRAVGL